METTCLSNLQLIELTSEKVFPGLEEYLKNELETREIEDQEAILNFLKEKKAGKDNRSRSKLSLRSRVIIMCMPFPILVYSIISGCLLCKGYSLKHRQYWKYINIGLMIYIFILLASTITYNLFC
ncbi:MAG: hypothetical protein AB8B53_01435 [Flavobacteriales bacterium]